MIKLLRENNLNIKNKNEKLEHFLSNKLYHRIIEDTRYFEGLLIFLTSIGTIFLYEIYSKKLKK